MNKRFVLIIFALQIFVLLSVLAGCDGGVQSIVEDANNNNNVRSCTNSAQCPKDEVCINKVCVKSDGGYIFCRNSADCRSDEECINSICQKRQSDAGEDGYEDVTPVESNTCKYDTDCPQGFICNMETKTCIPGGRIKVEPDKLEFGNVKFSQSITKSIMVTNIGNGDLTISLVDFESNTNPDPKNPRFTMVTEKILPAVLKPDDTLRIDVTYRQDDEKPDNGYLLITSSDATNPLVRVFLYSSYKGSADLVLVDRSSSPLQILYPTSGADSSYGIDLGNIPIGEAKEKIITLYNQAEEAILAIKGVKVTQLSKNKIEVEMRSPFNPDEKYKAPFYISAGEMVDMYIKYSPQDKESDEHTQVVITTNDPDINNDSKNDDGELTINIRGKAGYVPGMIEVDRSEIDFGEVQVGLYKEEIFHIRNTGEDSLIIDNSSGLENPNTDFSISPTKIGGSLSQSAELEVRVRFAPKSQKDYYNKVIIKSSDPDNPVVEIKLYGAGTDPNLVVLPDQDIDFGKVELGKESETKFISVSNSGSGFLTIESVGLSKGSSSDFILVNLPQQFPLRIRGGGQEVINFGVKFRPSSVSSMTGAIEIKTDDKDNQAKYINLLGEGLIADEPPDTVITTKPSNPTNSNEATFEFSCSELNCIFECRLDDGGWGVCSSPMKYTGLTDGEHKFEVRARDSGGNVDPSPANYTWVIDTVPPDTTITVKPPNPSNSQIATFEFSCNEQGCSFECQIDGGGFYPCSSPRSYAGLLEGSHKFEVKAKDAAGNIDPMPDFYIWTIDITSPDTTITSKPPNPSDSYSALFEFSCSEQGCSFECQLDGKGYLPCSSPKLYTGLLPVSHTFSVRAVDSAGNVDTTPATWVWKINPQLLWQFTTYGIVFSSPALGDLDGDGKMELVIGSEDYNIYAINGENASKLWSFTTNGSIYSSPALGDVDGDGKLEVVVGSMDGKLYALKGESGILLWSQSAGSGVYSSPALGDIDADGKLEVVVGSTDGKVYALRGENGQYLWSYATAGAINSSPALGDVDGDGKLEVVIGSTDGKIYVIKGENGQYLWSYPTGGAINSSPALADIDGDGRLEILAGSMNGKVYALRYNNSEPVWSYITGGGVYSSPALGDLDRDGNLEIAIGSRDGRVYVLNGENGSLLWSYITGGEVNSSPSIGDVDEDGRLEVVVGSQDGKFYVINGENGALLYSYTVSSGVDSSPAIGDIDGDGRLDIAFGSNDKKIYVLKSGALISAPSLLPWVEFGNRSYNRNRALDLWELNESIDRSAKIVDLVSNGKIPGYIWKVGDVDYYSFDVKQAPKNITIVLNDIPSSANYDLFLYSPSKTIVASSTNSGNSSEQINYAASNTGTYYIKVESVSGYSAVKPYSLYIILQ